MKLNDNIQIWRLDECNINFQSAIKIDIARNQSAIFVLLYAYCSFKLNNSII